MKTDKRRRERCSIKKTHQKTQKCKRCGKRKDFYSITNGRAEDVVTVRGPQDENGMKWLSFLKKQSFVAYKRELGNTARQRYVMYDAYRNEIFAVTDVGNRNLIIVEIDEKEKVYQI